MTAIDHPQPRYFRSADGLRIAYRQWAPREAPTAVLVINHGLNSHGGQYAWAGSAFCRAGFATYAIDMRGRGQSEGPRYRVDDIEDYVGDLHRLIMLARDAHPSLPIYLLGHSVGGVVSCTYALNHQHVIDGLICESFAFKVPAPDFAIRLLASLNGIAPGLPVLKLKNRDFTRDPLALAKLEDDPLIKGEREPVATVASLARANARLEQSFGQITLPVLILHGTGDRATLYQGSEFFERNAGSRDKTLKLYADHAHDLLNDLGKQAVASDIIAWIDERLPAPLLSAAVIELGPRVIP